VLSTLKKVDKPENLAMLVNEDVARSVRAKEKFS